MCGIVGSINFSGAYKAGMEKTIAELLFCDTLRGVDATGLYVVDQTLKVQWTKDVLNGWDFPAYNKKAKRILNQAENHTFIIGHNRAATKGDSGKVEFAHPIVIPDKLGLVHNGTLTQWPGMSGPDREEHDSTAIAQLIANNGVQDFVDSVSGAYSLVWHDMEADTLRFLRNDERPMAMMYSDGVIFYGSELGMIMWIAQRNGFKPVKHFYTEPMTLYTFEPGNAEPHLEKITKNFAKYAQQRFPGYQDTGGYYGPYHGRQRSEIGSGQGSDDDVDATTPELVRSRREAERLEQELAARANAADAEGSEGSVQTGESESGEVSGSRRRSRTLPRIGTGKPHGKTVERYKEFILGKDVLFSITDYDDVTPHINGDLYTVKGEPHHAIDHPRVIIRATVKTRETPVEAVQKSKMYWWGKINTIFEADTGGIVLWVGNINESEVPDPNYAINKVGKFNTDEVAEAVIISETKERPKRNVSSLEGKEICQGCSDLFTKAKLRLVNETSKNPTTKLVVVRSFRFCEDCCITYAEDREKVVPLGARGVKPQSADIVKFI